MNRKPFNLKSLASDRRDEIDLVLGGINGEADAILWTTAMRAAIRGGKCRMIGVGLEEPDTDR
jgi:hypothetical protein